MSSSPGFAALFFLRFDAAELCAGSALDFFARAHTREKDREIPDGDAVANHEN